MRCKLLQKKSSYISPLKKIFFQNLTDANLYSLNCSKNTLYTGIMRPFPPSKDFLKNFMPCPPQAGGVCVCVWGGGGGWCMPCYVKNFWNFDTDVQKNIFCFLSDFLSPHLVRNIFVHQYFVHRKHFCSILTGIMRYL